MNRLCGSGFQAIVTAAQEIQLGESDIVLCGGSENMSQAPYALRDARFGTRLGLDLKVTLCQNLVKVYHSCPQCHCNNSIFNLRYRLNDDQS